jgi:hypothetical protein
MRIVLDIEEEDIKRIVKSLDNQLFRDGVYGLRVFPALTGSGRSSST